MTEFTELDLNKDVDDMDEGEAKKTLSEFMEAHQENEQAYDALAEDLEETESEYQEKLAEKDEKIAEFREDRAEEAAEYVNMPAGLVADRFSIDEIEQIIDEAAEFSEEEDDTEDDEDDSLTTFSDKPEKGRKDSGDRSVDREKAEARVKQHW